MGRIVILLGLIIGLASCAGETDVSTVPSVLSVTTTTTNAPSVTTTTPTPLATTTTTSSAPRAAGIPDDFDTGPVWENVVRPELPQYSFQFWFSDGLVIVNNRGEALGHIPGPPDPPDDFTRRLLNQTAEAREGPRTVPEECLIDAFLGDDQLRLLCRSNLQDDQRGPTVEILLPDGTRRVVADLPPPPVELEGAYRLGRFLRVFPLPGRRGVSLAQFSAECESRLAVFIQDGTTYRFDGSSWWDDSYPDGESVALGWIDDRALIWRFNGPCATELAEPGVYAYTTDGVGELLFDTPAEVQWVELLDTEPAADTALYPDLGPTAKEQLIVSGGELPDPLDVAMSFATNVLRLGSPTVLSITESTVGETFTITDGSLTLDVRATAVAWNADGSPIIGVTYASSFTTDEEWFLAAEVGFSQGQWVAEFSFATMGDEAEVTYSSGDWSATDKTSDGQLLLELPHEPIETPRLTITFTEGGTVVGFHGTLLPAGAFAAG
jgi:hypothetical protein